MNNFAKSFLLHGSLVALILMFGTAAHQVQKQTHVEHVLFMPADLPTPMAPPSSLKPSESAAVPAQPTASVERLAVGMARANPAPHEAAPQLVKLDTSSPLELPQIAQRTVTAAPVARLVGFEQQTGVVGSGIGRGVNHAGFGAIQGTGRSGVGRVVPASFDMTPTAPAPARGPVVIPVPVQPPVVTYKATPVYTETARAARISGTVVLRVRFTAEGTVRVLGVVQGLGSGLDESAIRTAETMRFTPASRDGQTVAFDTTVRVTFQLNT